jgi:hypothetical protein
LSIINLHPMIGTIIRRQLRGFLHDFSFTFRVAGNDAEPKPHRDTAPVFQAPALIECVTHTDIKIYRCLNLFLQMFRPFLNLKINKGAYTFISGRSRSLSSSNFRSGAALI